MGHATSTPHVIHSTQEPAVICQPCGTTSNTIIRTPHGNLCPGCYKLLYSIPTSKPKELVAA